MPPRFSFLPPTVFFGEEKVAVFGRKKRLNFWFRLEKAFGFRRRRSLRIFFFLEITWFWPEKTFKFVISARKSLRISAKTFLFGDHLIFIETSPQSNSGIMKKLYPPDFNFAPPISRSWRRPWSVPKSKWIPKKRPSRQISADFRRYYGNLSQKVGADQKKRSLLQIRSDIGKTKPKTVLL